MTEYMPFDEVFERLKKGEVLEHSSESKIVLQSGTVLWEPSGNGISCVIDVLSEIKPMPKTVTRWRAKLVRNPTTKDIKADWTWFDSEKEMRNFFISWEILEIESEVQPA